MGVVNNDDNKEQPSVNERRFTRNDMLEHAQPPRAAHPSSVTNILHHHRYLVDGRTWSGKGKMPKQFQEWIDRHPGQPLPLNPEWLKQRTAREEAKRQAKANAAPKERPPAIELLFAQWLTSQKQWVCLAPDSATPSIVHRWNGLHFEHVATEEGVALALKWLRSDFPDQYRSSKALSCWQTAGTDMRNTALMPSRDKRHIVPCQGVYLEVLPSGQIVGHEPSQSFGMTHAIKIDPGTRAGQTHALKALPDTSRFAQFLMRAQPDPAIRALIQEQCGATLLSTRYGVAAWWYGAPGSGKSTLSELCGAMQAKCGATSLSQMTNDQFGLESLVGCGMIRIDEVEEGEKYNEGKLKPIITGNGISVDRKFEKPLVNYHFDAVLILCSNPKPFFRDKSDALWRRICAIHWGNPIPEGDQSVNWKDDVLASEGQLILDWMLEGAIRLVQRGRFLPRRDRPLAVQMMESDCRNEGDSVRYWYVDNRVSVNAAACNTKRDVYNHYIQWCDRIQREPVEARVFWKGLLNICGYTEYKKRIQGVCERVVDLSWRGPEVEVEMWNPITEGEVAP